MKNRPSPLRRALALLPLLALLLVPLAATTGCQDGKAAPQTEQAAEKPAAQTPPALQGDKPGTMISDSRTSPLKQGDALGKIDAFFEAPMGTRTN